MLFCLFTGILLFEHFKWRDLRIAPRLSTHGTFTLRFSPTMGDASRRFWRIERPPQVMRSIICVHYRHWEVVSEPPHSFSLNVVVSQFLLSFIFSLMLMYFYFQKWRHCAMLTCFAEMGAREVNMEKCQKGESTERLSAPQFSIPEVIKLYFKFSTYNVVVKTNLSSKSLVILFLTLSTSSHNSKHTNTFTLSLQGWLTYLLVIR